MKSVRFAAMSAVVFPLLLLTGCVDNLRWGRPAFIRPVNGDFGPNLSVGVDCNSTDLTITNNYILSSGPAECKVERLFHGVNNYASLDACFVDWVAEKNRTYTLKPTILPTDPTWTKHPGTSKWGVAVYDADVKVTDCRFPQHLASDLGADEIGTQLPEGTEKLSKYMVTEGPEDWQGAVFFVDSWAIGGNVLVRFADGFGAEFRQVDRTKSTAYFMSNPRGIIRSNNGGWCFAIDRSPNGGGTGAYFPADQWRSTFMGNDGVVVDKDVCKNAKPMVVLKRVASTPTSEATQPPSTKSSVPNGSSDTP